jgi:methyl-accepting chemotaxis protein
VLICYSVVRAIKQPLVKMIDLMSDIRLGNFTHRLALRRNDEFGVLGDGFDRMSDDLTNLVGQVQRSALQVASSVTENCGYRQRTSGYQCGDGVCYQRDWRNLQGDRGDLQGVAQHDQ